MLRQRRPTTVGRRCRNALIMDRDDPRYESCLPAAFTPPANCETVNPIPAEEQGRDEGQPAIPPRPASAVASIRTMNDDALNQFQRHFNQRDWDAASQVVQEAIRVEPSDWNAIYLSGAIQRYRGDFRGAIDLYNRALHLAGEVPSVLQGLGIAYQQLGDYPSALHALTRAAQLQPGNYEIHTSLGITYSMSGDTKAAIREHERAMEICVDRAFAEILLDRDRYFSIKDQGEERVFSLAPEYFTTMKQTLATDFRYFNAVKNMAACYMDIGDSKRAHQLMELADTCTPIEADLIGPIKRSSSC